MTCLSIHKTSQFSFVQHILQLSAKINVLSLQHLQIYLLSVQLFYMIKQVMLIAIAMFHELQLSGLALLLPIKHRWQLIAKKK